MSKEIQRVLTLSIRRSLPASKGGLIHPILGYYYASAVQSQLLKHYTLKKPQGIVFKNLQV
tara:strand:- start:1336 stop:1518 length:183 start_codon:yes stop_codon:yes gene_type:complete